VSSCSQWCHSGAGPTTPSALEGCFSVRVWQCGGPTCAVYLTCKFRRCARQSFGFSCFGGASLGVRRVLFAVLLGFASLGVCVVLFAPLGLSMSGTHTTIIRHCPCTLQNRLRSRAGCRLVEHLCSTRPWFHRSTVMTWRRGLSTHHLVPFQRGLRTTQVPPDSAFI
jgi:hypothetical protein